MPTFESSGGEIAFVDEGDGPPLVLLHGFPTSSLLWRRVLPPLAARMRVLAVDLLGYGRSAKPADAALHIRAQARYVRELLQGNGIEEFAVVGHDIGGGVAQLLALEGGVAALVLVDGVAFDAWPIEGVRMIQGAPFEGPEGARAFFRAARAIDGIGLADREADLSRLEIPTLLVWGEDDPYIPVEIADRLADLLPHAVEVLLPGCSHLVPEDAADTLAQLVGEFLRARYLGLSHGHDHASGPIAVDLHRHGPA